MAISLNKAQDIVQKLSNEQLMQVYTSGTLPQFVVFSEMQRRQNMAKNQAQMPTQTVAEKMVGGEPQGIEAAMPPQMAARGGITRASTLDMGPSEDLPSQAKKELSMRFKQMRDLEEPLYSDKEGYAEGGQIEDVVPSPDRGSPVSNKDIARMIMPSLINVESGGDQSAVSSKGATGVAQIMPKTGPEAAKLAGLEWDPNKYKTDPKYNAALGHAYLTSMLDRFGDREKALAAYNAGPGKLTGALQRAKETGGDWRSFLPRETQAYIGKVLGNAQAKLPERQTPQGAEAENPMKFGFDNTFAPPGTRTYYTGYVYPGKEDEPTNVDRGLAALKAAQAIKGVKFNSGGPVYLQSGTEDGTIDPDAPSGIGGLTNREVQERINDEERARSESIDRAIEANARSEKAKAGIPAARAAIEQQNINPETGKPYSVLDKARKAMQTPSKDLATMAFGTVPAPEVRDVQAADATSPSIFLNPTTPPGWEPPPAPHSGSPIPTPLDPSKMPSTSSIDKAIEKRGEAATPTEAARPRDVATGAQTSVPGMRPSIKEEQDSGFNAVFKQVQDAIGTKIPDELRENMKKHQETLSSMSNDKVVDALFAATKTLAGQRVGSVNYGDAVANAGLAAQEAQKRIYKADEEMRKYRAELLKAQDDGNYKAANIAMNRIVQADHDKRAMATAAMQADKIIQAEGIKMKQLEETRRRDTLVALNAELSKLTAGGAIQMQMLSPEDQARVKMLRSQIDALRSVDIKTGEPSKQTTGTVRKYNPETGKIE